VGGLYFVVLARTHYKQNQLYSVIIFQVYCSFPTTDSLKKNILIKKKRMKIKKLGLLYSFLYLIVSSVPNVELSPLCSPQFRPGPPGELAQTLSQFVSNIVTRYD